MPISDLFTVDVFTDVFLLVLVLVTAVGVIAVRDLFAATMLSGIYSLLMALVWVNMYAMDVAFTEAAVGAGVSVFLYLAALAVTGTEERQPRFSWSALLIVLVTGGALIYGTLDMHPYGDAAAPIHARVAPEYIQQNVGKVGVGAHGVSGGLPPLHDFGDHVPNTVTAVLASYRGYDTMFETAVICTAGLCLVLLLRKSVAGARTDEERA